MVVDIQQPDRPTQTDRVLDFIREFRAQHQVSPSVREIGRGVGISSTSVVNYHVGKLVTEGRLRKAVGQRAPRNLVPVNGKVSSVTYQVSEEDGFVD